MSDTSITVGVSFKAELQYRQDPDFMWCVDCTAHVSGDAVSGLKITRMTFLFVHFGTLKTYFVDVSNLDNSGTIEWLNRQLERRGDWQDQLTRTALGTRRGTVAKT